MAFRFFSDGKLAGLALAGSMLAIAGCQSGDKLGALNLGGNGGGSSQTTAVEERITVEELRGYCPSIVLRDTGAIFDSYARGGNGDPSKLNFRAALTDATRACRYGPTLGMTVALAGRIVPGPASSVGTIRLPLQVTIYRDAEEVYSQVYDYEVAIGDTVGATQFVFTDENISLPTPSTTNYRIYASFVTEDAR